MEKIREIEEEAAVAGTTVDVAHDAVLKTKDGLSFVYRAGTSDIKAIREACGNIDAPDEKKRSSSYFRTMREPKFKIDKDDVWLDCGAQIGSFSVRAVKNGAKKVISVEPEDINRSILTENVTRNKFQTETIIVPRAIVASDDMLGKEITLNKTPSTYRHTLLPVKRTIGSQNVTCTTLKQLFLEYPEINAVKVDIEGSEYDVVLSIDWKDTGVRKLVFEYSFDHHPDMNNFYDMIDLLRKQFDVVYHIASLPKRDTFWNTKITRGANGTLIWCVRNVAGHV